MTDQIRNYPYEVHERAAIYEYEAGMSRDEAERKAIDEYKEGQERKEGEKE